METGQGVSAKRPYRYGLPRMRAGTTGEDFTRKLRTMTIRTCIFDLGNVLVFFSHDTMVSNIAQVGGVEEALVRRFLFDDGYQWKIETGVVTPSQFHELFQRNCASAVSENDLLHAASNIFELNESMMPLLQELKQIGLRLVLLSNTCRPHIEFVRSQWSVLKLFDAVTTSWEVGVLKPHPQIYESALKQANCDPADCFYTDDIEDYVRQATAMNINAFVYQDAGTTRACLRSLEVPV